MALFSECTDRYAHNPLDTADIARDAMLRQRRGVLERVRSAVTCIIAIHSADDECNRDLLPVDAIA
jgi:hypothetical protein